mgnify:CR=1 FL=1
MRLLTLNTHSLVEPDYEAKRKFFVDFIAKEQPIRTFDTSTDGVLRLFTSHGACLTLHVEDIPETKPQAKPTNLSAVFELEQDEKLLAICDEDFSVGKVFFYTRSGLVKCTEASEYITKMKRIAAVNLKEGDGLVRVEYMRETTADSSILLVTEGGMSIRFASDTVPVTGRASAGVKCIKLDDGDGVIFAGHVPEEGELLVATDQPRLHEAQFHIRSRNSGQERQGTAMLRL